MSKTKSRHCRHFLAIHWFVNGEDVGTGETYTVEYAKDDYAIQAKIVSADGEVFAESEVESVRVINFWLARVIVYLLEMLTGLLFCLSLPAVSVFAMIRSLFAA